MRKFPPKIGIREIFSDPEKKSRGREKNLGLDALGTVAAPAAVVVAVPVAVTVVVAVFVLLKVYRPLGSPSVTITPGI